MAGTADALGGFVELIPSKLPERRVSSIAPEPARLEDCEKGVDSPFQLQGSRLFSGNGRAIFIGLVTGAILISAAGYAFVRHERAQREEIAVPRLLNVVTDAVSGSPHTVTPPAPVIVQVDSDVIRVSAIALGHPRLAVINGRAVGEGDTITVHTPGRSVALTLRVTKIGDGRVELTDGMQTVHARLAVATPTPPDRR
jgi:hypothetical protein